MPTHVQFGMRLDERERQALALAAQGHTDEQIASDLNLSESTAKRTMHNLRIKLGAHSRAHAVAIGFVHGYLKVRERVAS